jgi:acylphosphatase
LSQGKIARHVVVRGRVQGVFFRASTRRRAESLAIAGWARNQPDGAVELLLEGAQADVDAMIEYCRRGPRGAHVEQVEVQEREPTGLRGFAIR